MIDVRFGNTDDRLTLSISGHAGYAEMGKDIVCASASTLAYTLAQNMLILYDTGHLEERPYIIMGNGIGQISVKPKAESKEKVECIFRTIKIGFNMLMENYNGNVKMLVGREP